MSKKPTNSNTVGSPSISARRLGTEQIEEHNSTKKQKTEDYQYSDHDPSGFEDARDISGTILLPTLPNAPLKTRQNKQKLAPVRLRLNHALNFVENEVFDSKLIDYSQGYENSQVYSLKFKNHMESVLEILKKQLPKNSLIAEVGCGKGDFLEMVQADGYFKIRGYDASYDGHNKSIEKRYLNNSDEVRCDIVVLRHVLEHVHQPYEFLSMLKAVFGTAKIYIEVPNYDWIIANNTFFDITYEHVNYFSQNSLNMLFAEETKSHGLLLDDQYQYIISNLSALNAEFNIHYKSNYWSFVSFNDLFPIMRRDINQFNDAAHNRAVFLWGASTKGCLFLAHCANQKRLVDKVRFAIDQNPKKIGKYLPGSLVAIKSKQEFFAAAKPGDLLLISNPTYTDEIAAEIKLAGLKGIEIKAL
jgi:hypothetical protein